MIFMTITCRTNNCINNAVSCSVQRDGSVWMMLAQQANRLNAAEWVSEWVYASAAECCCELLSFSLHSAAAVSAATAEQQQLTLRAVRPPGLASGPAPVFNSALMHKLISHVAAATAATTHTQPLGTLQWGSCKCNSDSRSSNNSSISGRIGNSNNKNFGLFTQPIDHLSPVKTLLSQPPACQFVVVGAVIAAACGMAVAAATVAIVLLSLLLLYN